MTKKVITAREEESKEYKSLLNNQVASKLLKVIGNNIQIIAFLGFYFTFKSNFDVKEIFVCLGFISKLQNPIAQLPYVFNTIQSSRISNKRIVNFLKKNEYNRLEIEKKEEDLENAIVMEKCQLAYGEGNQENVDQNFQLKDIKLTIKRGDKVGIVGKFGSGKTTLLKGFSSLLTVIEGKLQVNGSVALVNQTPWIFNGTIRDNIVIDQAFEEEYFFRVIDMCCLTQDLSKMEKCDLTWITQNGTNLSTGQRARIAVARAVYSRRDIILIDDLLSNIDPVSRKAIFEKVLMTELKENTVIFVTNCTEQLKFADKIILMQEGQIEATGTFEEIKLNFPFDFEMKATEEEVIEEEKIEKLKFN